MCVRVFISEPGLEFDVFKDLSSLDTANNNSRRSNETRHAIFSASDAADRRGWIVGKGGVSALERERERGAPFRHRTATI